MGDEHQLREACLADHQSDLDPEGDRIADSPGVFPGDDLPAVVPVGIEKLPLRNGTHDQFRLFLLGPCDGRRLHTRQGVGRGGSISPYLIGDPRDLRIGRTALRVGTLTHGEKGEPLRFADKVGARDIDGIRELLRQVVQDEARRLIGRAEFLGFPPGADSGSKHGIDGDRDDGEYGQAHQELDEREAVLRSAPSLHALTRVSSTSRRRWLEVVPAGPMKP